MTEPERSVCRGEVRHDRFGCVVGHAQELVLEVDDELTDPRIRASAGFVERRGEGSAVGRELKSFA